MGAAALLTGLATGPAGAETVADGRVVLDYRCRIEQGSIRLQPAAGTAHDILGPLERQIVTPCADIRAAGHTSLRAIAAELAARGIRTRRGGKWGVGNVKAVLDRIAGLESR